MDRDGLCGELEAHADDDVAVEALREIIRLVSDGDVADALIFGKKNLRAFAVPCESSEHDDLPGDVAPDGPDVRGLRR